MDRPGFHILGLAASLRRASVHRDHSHSCPPPYSPECVEGAFPELRP